MPFPYLAGASSAAESTDGSVPAAGAVPPAPAALPSHKPAEGFLDFDPRSAASARGSLSSSRGSGPLNFIVVLDTFQERDGFREDEYAVVDIERREVVSVWDWRPQAEADAAVRNRRQAALA